MRSTFKTIVSRAPSNTARCTVPSSRFSPWSPCAPKAQRAEDSSRASGIGGAVTAMYGELGADSSNQLAARSPASETNGSTTAARPLMMASGNSMSGSV